MRSALIRRLMLIPILLILGWVEYDWLAKLIEITPPWIVGLIAVGVIVGIVVIGVIKLVKLVFRLRRKIQNQ